MFVLLCNGFITFALGLGGVGVAAAAGGFLLGAEGLLCNRESDEPDWSAFLSWASDWSALRAAAVAILALAAAVATGI